jgi:hypothetical protein
VNFISDIQCEIPLLELIKKRLGMDIHFKNGEIRLFLYALVFYSVNNLEHRFVTRENSCWRDMATKRT